MPEDVSFQDFVRRIRTGDAQAAAELVQRFEPFIRREVRFHLRDLRLQRIFDSADICQSVLASFFARAASGQYDIEEPWQLFALLMGMARKKLAFQVRKQRTRRRDVRRLQEGVLEDWDAEAPGETPSELVAGKELLDLFRRQLNQEERHMAELRSQGCGWKEIAVQLGGTPEGRRMQLGRAIDRVAQQLGLNEEDGE